MHRLRQLKADEIEGLRQQVQSLIDDVLQAEDLEDALRTFLSEHLQAIRAALEEYQLTGSYRLARTVRSAAGDFATDRPVPESAQGKSLLGRFINVCRGIIVVTTAAGLLGLPPANLADAYDKLGASAPAVADFVQHELTTGFAGEIEAPPPEPPASRDPAEHQDTE